MCLSPAVKKISKVGGHNLGLSNKNTGHDASEDLLAGDLSMKSK